MLVQLLDKHLSGIYQRCRSLGSWDGETHTWALSPPAEEFCLKTSAVNYPHQYPLQSCTFILCRHPLSVVGFFIWLRLHANFQKLSNPYFQCLLLLESLNNFFTELKTLTFVSTTDTTKHFFFYFSWDKLEVLLKVFGSLWCFHAVIRYPSIL